MQRVSSSLLATALLVSAVLVGGCGPSNRNEEAAKAKNHSQSNHDSLAEVQQSPAVTIESVQRIVRTGDYKRAALVLQEYLVAHPNDYQAVELAGDLAIKQNNLPQATRLYQEALQQNPNPNSELFVKLSQLKMRDGCAFDALDLLERASLLHPRDIQLRRDLAGLNAMLGMGPLAIPHVQWLMQHGHGDPDSLVILTDPTRAEPDGELCRKALAKCPDDVRPQYCLAMLDAAKLQWEDVITKTRPVVTQHPEFLPAYCLLGRALIETNQGEEVLNWFERKPSGIESHRQYWMNMGFWAQKQEQFAEAARAYWEAIRLDELIFDEAHSNLMTSLVKLDRQSDAAIVSTHYQRIVRLRDAVDTFLERGDDSQSAAFAVADAMNNLGRAWEAEGWARWGMTLPKDKIPQSQARYQEYRAKLHANTPWQAQETKLTEKLNLGDLPVLVLKSTLSDVPLLPRDHNESRSVELRMADQAAARGIEYTCAVAPEAMREGHHIYQSVGGGVAVIDFDLNGFPDLAYASLDGHVLQEDSSPHCLYQNRDGQFREISELANYKDRGFGQGITVADYNEDGFPDLFDANIGQNRLYCNNGDGTFRDATFEAGIKSNEWTSCGIIVDLNQDGIPDLFEVHYCGGKRPFEQVCREKDRYHSCKPLDFDPEPDRVWQGNGDGTFTDVSSTWMDQKNPGRGLGVVAGFFDERPGLDLYVANDMSANHLWSASPGEATFSLSEQAVVRGVAVDFRGRSQASMGIATGDADLDGDLDFFLTHFLDDHNTFYEQVSPGLWSDRSYAVKLAQPSIDKLGWGTLFVDLDLDGRMELFVTNGHVDDFKHNGRPYEMSAQVFRSLRDRSWKEVDVNKIGDYFQAKHLGRSLVALDLERDGMIDLGVTHLYEPVSLLRNETSTNHFSLGLQFVATRTSRDAVGTIVTMVTGDQSTTHQLTSGDGYMGANQKHLLIGMGSSPVCDELRVRWPSGNEQTFGPLEGGGEYLLVEDQSQPTLLFEYPASPSAKRH